MRLEPHPDDFVEDGREAVDMIRGINHPNVTFLYCAPHTFHMGGEIAGIMQYAGDLLTHLHVADSFDHRASSGLRYIVNPPGATACVFAWEERAEASSRFMLEEMTRRTRDWGDPAR